MVAVEFEERVTALATKIRTQRSSIKTEEATKNAFVMPFISTILGYDVFNPLEVVPEFIADVGMKKGEKIDYAITRYVNETNRLYGVLNKRLSDREFIAGDYSIADMASYPWVVPYKNQGQNIDDFPHLKRWLETIGARPATVRAYAMAKEINPNFGQPPIRTEEERKLLFGQTAAVVR